MFHLEFVKSGSTALLSLVCADRGCSPFERHTAYGWQSGPAAGASTAGGMSAAGCDAGAKGHGALGT